MLGTCTQRALVNLTVNKAKFAEVQTTKRSWPSPQDYNEALQNPAINLAEPELKVGKPGLNKLGLPKAITGAFASVYYLDCPQQDFAVRCFLHNIADQKARYAKISEYLNKIALPIMADFDYLDKGVLAQGQWYPILKMDWVDGQNLIEYIGRNLDNAKVLEKLRLWLRQARHILKENGIAHGDLQHGNVLVGNDSIKLVDYDGMFVPSLAGSLSNELGHRNYQHPGRTKEHFGPYLDNFSAWLIDTCLYVLERDPRLWFTLHAGEDCLLFRERDLQDPYSSFAFHELESHPNVEIQQRVKLLRSFLALPVDKVPDINAEDVQLPSDLPVLDASKKKPDWLSSAQHLMAADVEPRSYVEQPSPSSPVASQARPYSASWWTKHPANPVNQRYSGQLGVLRSPPSQSSFEQILAWLGLLFLLFVVFFFFNMGVSLRSSAPSNGSVPSQSVALNMEDVQRFFDQGTHAYNLHDYQSALTNYQQALTFLDAAGHGRTVEAANCHYWIGRMQMQLVEHAEAYSSLYEAEAIYKELGMSYDVAKVQHAYGLNYMRQKSYAEAITWFETALRGFEHEPSSQHIEDCKADVSYYLGMAYAGNHQDKEATLMFRRLIDYYDGVTEKQPDYVQSRLMDVARYFSKHRQKVYYNQAINALRVVMNVNAAKP